MKEETFTIKNELLYGAMWGENQCKRLGFTGYVYSYNRKVGRAFIEYCICRIFSIHRMPGCGYDRYNEGGYKFANLTENEINDACEELKRLYDFIQKNFRYLID